MGLLRGGVGSTARWQADVVGAVGGGDGNLIRRWSVRVEGRVKALSSALPLPSGLPSGVAIVMALPGSGGAADTGTSSH